MIIDRDGNITIITQENATVKMLVQNIEQAYDSYKNEHLVINLSSLDKITSDEIVEFLRLNNNHRGANKSFVLVSNKVDLDNIPGEMFVVPTMQEAFDIIEMEDIERDLGF